MPKPLPVELRQSAVSAYRNGYGSYEQIAELFGVGRATINRWIRRYRENGNLAPEPHAGGQVAKIGEDAAQAMNLMVTSHPDWTIDEMTAFWKKKHDRDISRSAMVRALFRHGFSNKKKASGL